MIEEGLAQLVHDEGSSFYNPAQVYNRDLSVHVLRTFLGSYSKVRPKLKGQGQDTAPRILDAFTASGLRAIRYLKEIPNVQVTANDLSETAIQNAGTNLKHNQVEAELSQMDAKRLMYNRSFDVIDLDPYGTCSPFLDAAVQSVAAGGLLCITSTDAQILCGNNNPVCLYRYGSTPVKRPYTHEMAIRIILHKINVSCATYKKTAVPLLSMFIDFYVRVFVRVEAKPNVQLADQMSPLLQCTQCPYYLLSDNWTECPQCGHTKSNRGGPIFRGPLHCPEFLIELKDVDFKLASWDKITSLLDLAAEENSCDPLFISLAKLASQFNCSQINRAAAEAALKNGGFQFGQAHHEPQALKTDAPLDFVFDIMRQHILDKQLNPKTELAIKLMNKPIEHSISFEGAKKRKLNRFPEAFTSHWGPKRAV